MIDLTKEKALGCDQAAQKVPPVNGKTPNPSTVFRWITVGLKGVKLEHARIGRRIVTTEAALQRFFARLAEADHEPTPVRTSRSSRPRSESRRAKEIAAAEQQAASAGI